MYQNIIQTYANNWKVLIHTYFNGMYFLEILPNKYCKIKKAGKVYYSSPYVHLKPLPNHCKFYKHTAFDACDILKAWNSVRYTVALYSVQCVMFALCSVLCLHCALCSVLCLHCALHCVMFALCSVQCTPHFLVSHWNTNCA